LKDNTPPSQISDLQIIAEGLREAAFEINQRGGGSLEEVGNALAAVQRMAVVRNAKVNTCGTCKYFQPPPSDDIYCPSGYHVCAFIEHARNRGEIPPPAVLVDASDYHAALCVKEDFGCNQWMPLPEPPK
jgi:hypothetical protein